MTDDPREKGMLEINKQSFIERLRKIPRNHFNESPELQKLITDYYSDLKNCDEEIEFDLERFGTESSMTYSDFFIVARGN
jgi:hypothetical protein